MSTSASRPSRIPLVALIVSGLLFVGVLGARVSSAPSLPGQPVSSVADGAILTQDVPASLPNSQQVRRGQYLVRVGDCLSCHLAPGGKPFAGGVGINTPFGVIYSPNITPDKTTGIGNWTDAQFYRAMHDGIGVHGERLYPAFPYPWFTQVSRSDSDAIFAYLKTVPPASYSPPGNRLPFPINLRILIAGWNALNFDRKPLQLRPELGAEWNRGALIVNGLGHCSGCHSPKNALGGDQQRQFLAGGNLGDSVAPDLTSNPRTGLGRWSVADIVEYLQTGRNDHSSAGSAMADVVTYSTSLLSPSDLHAIAVYLKSLPPSRPGEAAAPDALSMKRGGVIYSDVCTGCHLEGGRGQSRLFPPIWGSAVAQQDDPTGLIRMILAGTRVAPTRKAPSPLAMPSFAWKLDDQEVADVATFVRNSWGNQAPPVDARRVRTLRKKLELDVLRLTVNSGDHDQVSTRKAHP